MLSSLAFHKVICS